MSEELPLPVKYDSLHWTERKQVREQYVRLQAGLCLHCKKPLSEEPAKSVNSRPVNKKLFPANFFNHPVHLHHSHKTGLTLGAVHCYCNAVLWEYYGE